MASRIKIRQIHPVEWALDHVMIPLMWLIQGTQFESVQRTHRWNNHHLSLNDVLYLDHSLMVRHGGDPNAKRPWLWGFIPLFHIPGIGGWRRYIVVAPRDHLTEEWFPGWIAGGHAIGVSRLPIFGSVKMLIGPGECEWFGITADGKQVALREIGQGQLGDKGPWRYVPLR